MSIQIIIGADIVPTESNYHLFKEGDIEKLIGNELWDIFGESDLKIFNLEVPLCDSSHPIQKIGPNLIAPTYAVNGLKKLADVLCLANNHILDQGAEGLLSTIRTLDYSGIDYVGAGLTVEESVNSVYLKSVNGLVVGVYACAEHEFTTADGNGFGATPYDPLNSFDAVRNISESCDICIVLYHGGKEYYQYPSPNLQKIFRKFAECGANIVVSQHSHCIGSMEKYRNSTLIYGQGNFVFDRDGTESNPYYKYWQESLLLKVNLSGGKVDVSYIPIKKSKEIIRFDNSTASIDNFFKRSENITKDRFLVEEYRYLAEKMRIQYLYSLSGGYSKKLLSRIINKISKKMYLKRQYSGNNRLEIQNCVRCEAHRELLLEILSFK